MKKGEKILNFFLGAVIALLIAELAAFFTIRINYIPSGSMEGTIQTGDIVISTLRGAKEPERYDIMVFNPPDEPEESFIKRVIGLPGETITIEDGRVYADGVELDDSFIKDGKMPKRGEGTYQVPEDCYFMMGDNRCYSLDSRFWDEKYVPRENLDSRAQTIIFPLRNAGSLKWEERTDN